MTLDPIPQAVPEDALAVMATAFRNAFAAMPEADRILFEVRPGGLQGGTAFVTAFQARTADGQLVRSGHIREAFFNWCSATAFADRIAADTGLGSYVVSVQETGARPVCGQAVEVRVRVPEGISPYDPVAGPGGIGVHLLGEGLLTSVFRVNYPVGIVYGTMRNEHRATLEADPRVTSVTPTPGPSETARR